MYKTGLNVFKSIHHKNTKVLILKIKANKHRETVSEMTATLEFRFEICSVLLWS